VKTVIRRAWSFSLATKEVARHKRSEMHVKDIGCGRDVNNKSIKAPVSPISRRTASSPPSSSGRGPRNKVRKPLTWHLRTAVIPSRVSAIQPHGCGLFLFSQLDTWHSFRINQMPWLDSFLARSVSEVSRPASRFALCPNARIWLARRRTRPRRRNANRSVSVEPGNC